MSKTVLLSLLAASSVSARNLRAPEIPTPEIVGGDQAAVGDYPYFVHMGGCGGALIAPDIVLFAAHCRDWSDRQISISAYETQRLSDGAQDRYCDEWIADPLYDASTTNYDFALCKLNTPVTIDESKIKLELNEANAQPQAGDDLHVMGLGALRSGGPSPQFLQHVTVPAITNAECNKASSYDGAITEMMLCAGFPETGGKDSCQGDSGGPIVKRTSNGDGTFTHTHVGVVSWGVGCAAPNFPGVYARTSKRVDWIKDTMCKDLKSISSTCSPKNDPPPPPSGDCAQDLTVTVNTDKYGYETKWTLTDSKRNEVKTRQYLFRYNKNEHKLCLKPNEKYEIVFYDDYGDGMCDETGTCGSYSLVLNGKEVVSGDGKFNNQIKESFTTDSRGGDGDDSDDSDDTPKCTDDPDFRYKGNNKKDCAWVGKNTEKRCALGDGEVATACPATCNSSCSNKCSDNEAFRQKGLAKRSCEWVAERPDPRCGLDDGETIQECAATCNPDCRGDDEDDDDTCLDNPDYLFKGRNNKDCDWVGKKPEKRCDLNDSEPFYECPEACGNTECETP